MGSTFHILGFLYLFYLLSCFSHETRVTNSLTSSKQTLCRDHERSALLQFKQSFSLNQSASLETSAPPKDVASWKPEVEADCCLWDGVECSEGTGHVIGLDLGSSFLYGSINSSSSIFNLVNLQILNLADNDFNYSQIPPEVARLSRLSHLNLSSSVFSGQVPSVISNLSKLVSLDLSMNLDRRSSESLLKLKPPILRSLATLSNLKTLYLGDVYINSTIPEKFANMSSMTALSLHNSDMHGEIPKGIFLLPNLQMLFLYDNADLTGNLPEFQQTSPLQVLSMRNTGLSGSVPASLANLSQLDSLNLSLTKCNIRDLSWLGKLTKLTQLWLVSVANIQGELPPSLANLTLLNSLALSYANLTGQIPSWLFNMTQLSFLDLSYNKLQGSIPNSFSQLMNLEYLALQGNDLFGTVEGDIFLNLKKITSLNLSHNNISFLINNTTANATLPKFHLLALGSCNLREFPHFLRFQDELEILSISNNMIDRFPEWMWNKSKATPGTTSGFDHHPVLPWANIFILDLRQNNLQGSVPIPPLRTSYYYVSNNRLTGEIPQIMCSLTTLSVIDFSNNNMSGTIPQCLGNFSNSLTVMNLKGNNFHGPIPQGFTKSSNLKMMDLSQNRLEGQLPQSLANCSMLQILDLGNNQIEDTFPFWLGDLMELQVLILASNRFHGILTDPTNNLPFAKLRIIDLSNNSFRGHLPQKYFRNWNGMKHDSANFSYLQLTATFQWRGGTLTGSYTYSMQITNKGVKTQYERIMSIFTAVDLSSNNFSGEIPDSVATLKGLQLLNLSNNGLLGGIPSSIGNLTQLESLDLSANKLSGEIPLQLTQLSFLAYLNVSDNHLSGPIPQGKQFFTFQNNSYQGNAALCGDPLSIKCGNLEASTPPPSLATDSGDDSRFPRGVDWVIMFTGIGSGLVVGLIFGTNLIKRNHEWFVEKFGKWPKKWRSISPLERGKRYSNR